MIYDVREHDDADDVAVPRCLVVAFATAVTIIALLSSVKASPC